MMLLVKSILSVPWSGTGATGCTGTQARVLHAAEVAELPDVVMVAPRPRRGSCEACTKRMRRGVDGYNGFKQFLHFHGVSPCSTARNSSGHEGERCLPSDQTKGNGVWGNGSFLDSRQQGVVPALFMIALSSTVVYCRFNMVQL